jgi:hypothetical protein
MWHCACEANAEICEGRGTWAALVLRNGDKCRSVQVVPGEEPCSGVGKDTDEAGGEAAVEFEELEGVE